MKQPPVLTVIAGRPAGSRSFEETHRTARSLDRWLETLAGAIFVGACFLAAVWFFAALVLSLGVPA